MRTARIVIFGIAGALLAFALYTLLTPPKAGSLPAWNRPVVGYEIINLFLVVVSLAVGGALVRVVLHKSRERLVRGVKRLVAVCVVVSALLVTFDIVLASWPEMQKEFVSPMLLWPQGYACCEEDYALGYKGKAGFEQTLTADPMKDLPGNLSLDPRKIPQTGEQPFTVHVKIDANGFPNPAVPASAEVVVVGDSFTTPWYTAEGRDWVSLLKAGWKTSLYNLSMPGWGPLSERLAYFEYGVKLQPRYVIWAFYDGNDILDAGFFCDFKRLQAEEGMTWRDFTAMKLGLPPLEFPYDRPLARLLLKLASRLNPPERGGERSPPRLMTLTAGGRTLPQYVGHFITMALERQELSEWPEWGLATNAVGEVAEECRKRCSTLVFVYLPSKEHVYLRMILQQADAGLLYRLGNAPTPKGKTLGQDEFLRRLETNSENMRKLMKDFCDGNNIVFIDATSALREAAERGEFPYYCCDIHFNEKGNAIVAEAILARLSALPAGSP